MVTMKVDTESVIKSMISLGVSKIQTCTPAVVVDNTDLEDGFIHVQPLINHVGDNLETVEQPIIYNVPVIMPSTSICGIVFPVNIGDTVLLIFSKRSLDEFKFGSDVPHDPSRFSTNQLEDVVAFVGFNITQKSVWHNRNHSDEHSIDSVKVYNNKGTGSENFIEMKSDGSVKVKSPSQVDVEAPVVNAKLVNVDDVIINGVGSVKAFMLGHTHNYTDDGNPMVTAPPNPVG